MKQKLPIPNPYPESELAIKAVLEAGEEVMRIYNQEFSTKVKDDNEPLTEADLNSDTIIQKILLESGYPVLSEEAHDNKKRLNSKKIWIVDPLDGTSDFIKRTGEFTIMISLVENHLPILGVIFSPSDSTLYFAQKGSGAFKMKNSWSKLAVSNISKLQNCRAVGSRYHISDKEQELIKILKLSKFSSKGSSLKVAEIAAGKAELYFTTTSKIKQWDTCASYCLIYEAGGKMTDMYGNELQYNTEILNHENGILVSNGIIHNQIIETYLGTKNKK